MKRLMLAVSLIEVLIAMAVLSIGVVSLVKFQSHLSNNHIISAQQSEAIALARAQIMTGRHQILLSTMTPPSGTSYAYPTTGQHTTTIESTTYTISYTYTKTNSPEHETLDVTVSWADPSNVTRSVALSTKVANVPATKLGEAMDDL